MDAYKNKITELVKNYMAMFPEEFELVKKELAAKRTKNRDKFAAIEGTDVLQRAIHEIPMTLETVLSTKLKDDELQWFRTIAGARWFARKFPVFKSPDLV